VLFQPILGLILRLQQRVCFAGKRYTVTGVASTQDAPMILGHSLTMRRVSAAPNATGTRWFRQSLLVQGNPNFVFHPSTMVVSVADGIYVSLHSNRRIRYGHYFFFGFSVLCSATPGVCYFFFAGCAGSKVSRC